MPNRHSFSDSGLATPGLAFVPAPSDAEGQEAGIAQFGQLHPGPVDYDALRIKKESQTDGFNSIDQAGDRFATLFFNVDNRKAYQLLPVDPNRKRATIYVAGPNTNIVLIGDLPTIDAAVASLYGGFPLIGLSAPFVYLGKSPLYACSGVLATSNPVSIFVEKFNAGVNIGA